MSPRVILILSGIGALAIAGSLYLLFLLLSASDQTPGYAGFGYDDLTKAQVTAIARGKGMLVHEVVPGSPADKAGLRVGDLIVTADEQPATSRELFAPIRKLWMKGSTARLGVIPVPTESSSAPLQTPKTIDVTLISYEELHPLLLESTPDQ